MFWKWVECGRRQLQGNLYQKPDVFVLSHCLKLGEEWRQVSEGQGKEGRQLTLFLTPYQFLRQPLIYIISWRPCWAGNTVPVLQIPIWGSGRRGNLLLVSQLLNKKQSSKPNPDLSTASPSWNDLCWNNQFHKLKQSPELSWALWMCPEAIGLVYKIQWYLFPVYQYSDQVRKCKVNNAPLKGVYNGYDPSFPHCPGPVASQRSSRLHRELPVLPHLGQSTF